MVMHEKLKADLTLKSENLLAECGLTNVQPVRRS
jgi:hypothetical protein